MSAQTSPQSRSAALYDHARRIMPGGCSRNTVLRKPHPLYVEKGAGCYVTDIEGVTRIDFSNNMASLIHGHAHPAVVEAVSTQLQKGTAFSVATEVEIEYAELILGRNATFENLRFVNSGTEAVMSSLKAARAYTGRSVIAKVEGAYHGQYDYAEVSQTAKPDNWGDIHNPTRVPVAHGTPESALQDVIVIPYNKPEYALEILTRHRDELACVMLDLMPHRVGLVPATQEYVQAIADWTRQNNVLLIFDEVITFRTSYGGMQDLYGVQPDITAMGKIIGGGFPVGAIAGRKEVMSVMDPLADRVLFPHSGTFSANPVTMTAGLVSMKMFDQTAVAKLNRLGDMARSNIAEAIDMAGIPASVTGGGSMFRIHMKAEAPDTYRAAYMTPKESEMIRVLLDHCFDSGLIMINTCSAALSTAMTPKEIEILTETLLTGFRKVKKLL
jgi:glutamate-1-semialdehyde 2,1-aminomutase